MVAINIDHEIDFATVEFFMQRPLRSQGGGKVSSGIGVNLVTNAVQS